MNTTFTNHLAAVEQTQQITDVLLSPEEPYSHLRFFADPPSVVQLTLIKWAIDRLQVPVLWHRLDEALAAVCAAMGEGLPNPGKAYFLQASRDLQLALIHGALNNKVRCFDAWTFDQACRREHRQRGDSPMPEWEAPGITMLAYAYSATDLHVLIKQRAPVEVIKLAIEWAADVNALDGREHMTALHWFARGNYWENKGWADEVVRLLFDAGVDSAIADPKGFTALDYAAMSCSQAELKALALAGAFYTRTQTAEYTYLLARAGGWADALELRISRRSAAI
ncbi:ankyrin repeat protein [Tahibacter aquaticus]|uniref:Ankyrin repeat protein n=1 Tax=Tahibacter aquaticus TaxID=520092 RepID=A0A4R6Z293_9GAMM|nr:ankyrin repeat domain-containing protein [Tahibacter aquaticus]TDR45697.1 ankyrin repeat protein [Tahibacter aquaticus]